MITPAERQALRRANHRARYIRARIRDGEAVSDIDHAWLRKYEDESVARRGRCGKPTVSARAVFGAIHGIYGVDEASVCRARRTTTTIGTARAVAAVALHRGGHSPTMIGVLMHRTLKAASKLLHASMRIRGIEEKAAAVLIQARGAVAGDLIMVPIVVGSDAWKYIDRLQELDERTASVIRHLGSGLMLDHVVGSE